MAYSGGLENRRRFTPSGGSNPPPSAMCCSTGPANFVGSPGAAGQTSPVFQCCGPLPSGRRPFFFPLLPLPVESPAKAADSRASATERRPTGPCPLRRRKLRASTATRNGAALHVFCVVSHVTPQRQTPGGFPFPPGVIFSRSIPMRQDDRPFWQEVREELSPRRNPIGWACILAILGMFCLVGYFDHPAEPVMRPAIIVSK